MKRLHSNPWSKIYNPFALYAEIFKSSLQIAEMLNASGEVISHRSGMIADAFNGTTPFTHKEFATMWQEKFAANTEAFLAITQHMSKTNPAFSTRTIKTHVKGMQAVIKPYHKKSTANALRLRKKQ